MSRAKKLQVVVLLVTAAALLAVLVGILGNFSLSPGWHLYVDFDFAGSIQTGAPVKVSGIKVGKIEEVRFIGDQGGSQSKDDANRSPVRVQLVVWIEERVRGAIRQDAEFFVNTAGVLGEQYLEIVPGSQETPPLQPNVIVRGVDPPRTDLIIARLYEFLDAITKLLRDDRDIIRDFLKSGASVVRTIDGLLDANRDQLSSLIGNLDRFTVETTSLVRSVRNGVGDADRIRATMNNIEQLSASINRDIDPLIAKTKRALDGLGELADVVGPSQRASLRRTLDQLSTISERVSKTTTEAQQLVGDLRAGKGTAGQFLRDEQMYDDVKEMVRDLKRNPWKFLWRE